MVESLRVSTGERLVFIGDSNTDTEYRTRFPPHGYGYVMFVANMIAARLPELSLEVVNRGNDGDTIEDLAKRWQQDVIDLKPDWVFVLIGTNDVAYRYFPEDAERQVDDEQFERGLSEQVARTRAETGAKIVLIEPMPYDIPASRSQEPNAALEKLCACIARVAETFACEVVPVRAGLAEVLAAGRAKGWYQNFNHPAFPGHTYIAQQVLRHLGWQL